MKDIPLTLPSADYAKEVSAEFKTSFLSDPSKERLYSEIYRARWVLYCNRDSPSLARVLRSYAITNEVIKLFNFDDEVTLSKKTKRQDRYDSLVDWCKENHLKQISATDLSAISGMSYPTVLKFISDRPDLFFKIKKGLYEVRNPEIFRKEEETHMKAAESD